MNRLFALLILPSLLLGSTKLFAQSTFDQVYSILSSNTCGSGDVNCHSGTTASGLDFSASTSQVYNQLYYQLPNNSEASGIGDRLVLPGNPYRSYLFRKINHGLAPESSLNINEGDDMPPSVALTEKQRELIRQWIIYGAPETGEVVDVTLIDEFYDNGGIESVPNPPQPPQPWEGFQLHLGPIFLPPLGESPSGGHYARFDMNFPDTVEATKVASIAGDGAHHTTLFIYNNASGIDDIPYGVYGVIPAMMGMEILATYQQVEDELELPSGTAYQFPKDSPLIFNSHYFNSSPTQVRKCDTYFNIYTQPKNTAAQVMKFGAHSYHTNPENNNPPLYIPADAQPYTFQEYQFEPQNSETRYLWAMIAHVHEHCVDYKVYRRNPDGSVGETLTDVSCINGIPGCSFPYFDPWHIPTRYFDEFEVINMQEGFFHQATYVNHTSQPLTNGPSAFGQEMMVFGYYYIEDTVGVDIGISNPGPSDISEVDNKIENQVSVYPNPSSNQLSIMFSDDLRPFENAQMEILDATGKTVVSQQISNPVKSVQINNNLLQASGMYSLRLLLADGRFLVKRIVRQ